jgi:nucleotide-binding universal stress UspA family protein
MVVPVVENLESERAMDVACRLASEHHATITAVTVIEVPTVLPLDAHMIDEEGEARQLLDRLGAIGESYGVSVTARVLRAREAGTAIVQLAEALKPELVVIGGTRKRRRSPRSGVFGATVHDVLKKAPCRVMVIAARPSPEVGSDPERGQTLGGSGESY